MNSQDYIDRISNYIFDKRNTRALLIDGEWGCGKSFFVKNSLIPHIKKTRLENNTSAEEKFYIPVYVSLFGLSSIDSIQELIYTTFLEALCIDDKNEKTKFAVRNICLFGSKIVTGIGNIFNVGEDVNDVASSIDNLILDAKKEQIVLIFDDFERCQVDVVELMGFLNNLTENNDYRLIIVSNEKEISKHENATALAIQKQVSLLDMHFNSNMNEDNNSSSSLKLNQHMLELFDKDKQYEITREKLIGLTIRFDPELEDVYELIAKEFASDDHHYDILISYKQLVINTLDLNLRKNLRTLGTVFICIESISDCMYLKLKPHLTKDCEKYGINITEVFFKVKSDVISYIVKTACEYSIGATAYNWTDRLRYGEVEYRTQICGTYFGFAFVDEYWKTLYADKETINKDFNDRVTDILTEMISRKTDSAHYELACYKLYNWESLDQETISELLKQLKNELSNKKYKANEFKGIIELLMRMNNPFTGMYIGLLGENADNYKIDNDNNQVLLYEKHFFKLVNIPEYVDLMLNYFDEPGFNIDKQMLEYPSSDKSTIEKYNEYIQPIINRIEDVENRLLRVTENGNNVFDNIDNDLFEFLKSNHDSYIRNRQFFSVYGYDSFNKILLQDDPLVIRQLSETFSRIYNISNLEDFFTADLDVIKSLHSSLSNDRVNGRKVYNAKFDRAKEMRLREIEVKLYDYILRISR